MNLFQHGSIYMWALADARKHNCDGMMQEFKREIPFVLLPDAIRAYVGPRQMSHFEQTPDGTAKSWMRFPDERILKLLTPEKAADMIRYEMADGYQPCVIGETTDLSMFDYKNLGHEYYHALRIHLLQDHVLDTVLREVLVNVDQRFKDVFVVRHNRSVTMDGAELRRQIANFERIGFIKLAGLVFERTGILLSQAWFDKEVYPALLKAYPKDLADKTYRYMKLDDETENRIQQHQFDITEEDASQVPMAFKLDDVLLEMYAEAYDLTKREL